jgi:uncharacterized protein (TIGR00290 family)
MDEQGAHPQTWAVSWSGGKDSALALDRARRAGLHVRCLLTLYDPVSERVRFHGTTPAVLAAQAEALGCDLLALPAPWEHFERAFLDGLGALRERGVGGLIFGNIHLADVRAWYEERVVGAGLRHHEPLWGERPVDLLAEVVARGFDARLVCVELARLPRTWLGRRLDERACAELSSHQDVDPCGERGEYHTLVVGGPHFSHPLAVRPGAVHEEGGFLLQDLALAQAEAPAPQGRCALGMGG